MSECKHEFIGAADGVHCIRCGAQFSPSEYAALINRPREPESKKPRRAGKKVTTHE